MRVEPVLLAAQPSTSADRPGRSGGRDPTKQELERRIALLEAREAALLERLKCIAHDLASPLTPMNLQVARWEDQGLTVPGAGLMRRSIERLCQMTQDVSDLACARTGMRVQEETFDLRDVARDAFDAFRPQRHDIRLVVPDGPLHVVADRLRILQALDNLLRNATKFTPPGGRITIELLHEGAAAALAVRDTGRGLSGEEMRRLFQPHAQARAEDATHGSGLGLYITRTIVEQHGGTVQAESAGAGYGSRFVLRLPLVQPPAWQDRPAGAQRPLVRPTRGLRAAHARQ